MTSRVPTLKLVVMMGLILHRCQLSQAGVAVINPTGGTEHITSHTKRQQLTPSEGGGGAQRQTDV